MDAVPFDVSSLFADLYPHITPKAPLTKEQLCAELVKVINPNETHDDMNAEIYITNYVYATNRAISDLREINQRLIDINKCDSVVPKNKEYVHRKMRYFSEVNKRARDRIFDFLSRDLFDFLNKSKAADYAIDENSRLLDLQFNGFYEYRLFKKYYDFGYDFSTEAKIRFIPGVDYTNLKETVDKFTELKLKNLPEYQAEISRIINENDVIEYLCQNVEVHNVMNERLETFNAMKTMYASKNWQAFISLAILQIEGLFYDCCRVLGPDFSDGEAGTLVEKVEKSFRDDRILMLSVYPYYMFDVPEIRNEIAHKGITGRQNLEQIANELVLDLNTIISWIYRLSRGKYSTLLMISDAMEKKASISRNEAAGALLVEMISCMAVSDFAYLDFVKNPGQFSDEIRYMKTPDGFWEGKAQILMNIIKTKEFWEEIEKYIDVDEASKQSTPFNMFVLAEKLKNTFIPVLDKDSPEKLACSSVAAKISRSKNSM